jgi:hypothetical protein
MEIIKRPGLSVGFSQSFLNEKMAGDVFDFCKNLHWKPNSESRMSNITFGEKGLVYVVKFKENTVYRTTIPWENYEIIMSLKKMVEELTGETAPHGYNYCVIMKYANNDVIIKPHRDKEMVHGTSICGISVGSTRSLKLTPTYNKYNGSMLCELTHGSLYCLLPPTNDNYLHEILPGGRKNEVRYSLTFRNVAHAPKIIDIPPKTISVQGKCPCKLKTGLRKGESCGALIKDGSGGNFCKRHR